MKKLFFVLLMLMPFIVRAQVLPVQDTVITQPPVANTLVPQFKSQNTIYGRLPYMWYPAINKYDLLITSKYLRAYYAPLTAISGLVQSVSGTVNRITSTGGTTPVIDISASYVGQTSLTTLGTIGTGVWQGTPITNSFLANSTISGISLGSNLNNLTFNNSGSGAASGTTYNGGTGQTISYNTIGAAPASGSSSYINNQTSQQTSANFNIDGYGESANSFNVGSAASTGISFLDGKTTSLATHRSFTSFMQIATGTTVTVRTFESQPTVLAGSGTVSNLELYSARFGGIGAGSAVTNLFGFAVQSNVGGATNNFAYWTNVAGGTGKWAFVGVGTAVNNFVGNTAIGFTPTLTSQVTAKLHLGAGTATAGTSPEKFGVNGVILTTPEAMAFEATNSHLFFTDTIATVKTRRQLAWTTDIAVTSLTTTGSGAATLTSGVLNIPTPSAGFANPMTTLGDIIYGGASGTPTRLAGNTTTTTKFFTSTGNGSVSAAPVIFDLFNTVNIWSKDQDIAGGNLNVTQSGGTGGAANIDISLALKNQTSPVANSGFATLFDLNNTFSFTNSLSSFAASFDLTNLSNNRIYKWLDVAGSVPATTATNDITAQTSAGNITTFTVGPATATFNVSAYLNVTAVATDVIQVQVTYTDENTTSQTVSFTTLSTVTNSTYSPVTIRAKTGTTITVKTNLTVGAGSVTFDAGARITQL